MKLYSEYNTKPARIIVNDPVNNTALKLFKSNDKESNNFRSIPDVNRLAEQFNNITKEIMQAGIKIVNVAKELDENDARINSNNPNSIFTRDALITIPWLPNFAIVPRMSLEGRRQEPSVMKKVAIMHGITEFLSLPDDLFLEGGDVIPDNSGGKRTLVVGIGSRTTERTVHYLAEKLFHGNKVDMILAVRHKKHLLHLDTSLSLLPNSTLVYSVNSLIDGFIKDKEMKMKSVDPLQYLFSHGFSKQIEIPNHDAIVQEQCNLLYVGDNRYLSFQLNANLKKKIIERAGIAIVELDGSEIAKANGGIHCLTRPIY